MDAVVEHILNLPPWLALVIVFAMPALESSIFLGFVFPGEIACILGGVLAFESKLVLPVVIMMAVLGAIIGDSVGYFVGARFGDTLLDKLPPRFVKPEHVERSKALIRRLGGRAVFVGRFTAALRALVPGFAGVSQMRYRTFLVWNVLGGLLWASGVVVAGYLAGDAWRRIDSTLSIVGYAILGAVVIGLVALWWIRRRRADPADRSCN
jgi:undecaprenyl-diphosphatase